MQAKVISYFYNNTHLSNTYFTPQLSFYTESTNKFHNFFRFHITGLLFYNQTLDTNFSSMVSDGINIIWSQVNYFDLGIFYHRPHIFIAICKPKSLTQPTNSLDALRGPLCVFSSHSDSRGNNSTGTQEILYRPFQQGTKSNQTADKINAPRKLLL